MTSLSDLTHLPKLYRQYINGEWGEAQSGKRFDRYSPAHDVLVGTYPLADKTDVDRAVSAARIAFDGNGQPGNGQPGNGQPDNGQSSGEWRSWSGNDRSKLLLRTAQHIRERAEELARVEVLESGKPLAQARGEMASTAEIWEYAAALARVQHGDSYNTLGPDTIGLILREPIGVVAMITPWNFPLLIVSQKLPFALAAGCTAVIKPSELTPGTTLMLAEILHEAGLPAGVVNVVTGYGDPVGQALAEHPDVDMISFTGSTAVGKVVVQASAGNLKKVALELGGKNPQIVFPDADLDAALDAVAFGVYFNMGECCNSGSRLLIHESIADEFARKLVQKSAQVIVGDPLDEATTIGAIINQKQADKIRHYIQTAQQEGATLLTGGNTIPTERGCYLEPTIFTHVRPDMKIASEEIFGPVLSILTFSTPEEALRIANSTLYGLSAGVWTRDLDTAMTLARGIRAGTVWVNSFMDGWPELPFGGYAQSGLGRELGRFSVDEFTELKTVPIHLGQRKSWWLPKAAQP